MLASVEVYKKIAPKLGEQEASDLILFIEDSVRNAAVTKADLQSAMYELEKALNERLTTEIENLRKEFKAEIAEVRKEFKAEIAEVRKEFKAEIAEVRKEVADVRKEIADVRKEVADVRKEIADVRKEVAELRGLLLKYILPMSSLIGGIVGTIISVLLK